MSMKSQQTGALTYLLPLSESKANHRIVAWPRGSAKPPAVVGFGEVSELAEHHHISASHVALSRKFVRT